MTKKSTKTDAKTTLKRLAGIEHALLNTDLVMAELLVHVMQLETVVEQAPRKNKAVVKKISELRKQLLDNKDSVLARSVKHEYLIAQNHAYRTESLDFTLKDLQQFHSSPNSNQIEPSSDFNKYSEILKLEKLKNIVAANVKCLSEETCYLCYFDIQKNTCADDTKLTNEQILSKFEESYFAMIIGPMLQEGTIHFLSRVSKLNKIQL